MPHLFPLSSGVSFSSCAHQIQIGLKTFTSALSIALLGVVTLVTSLCSRIYRVFSCQISRAWSTAAGGLEARARSLKLWVSSKSSGNANSPSLGRMPSPSPSTSARRPGMRPLSLPLHSQPPEVPGTEGRRSNTGPGPFIRKIISFANFKQGPATPEDGNSRKARREPKRGVSFLDMSASPQDHRTSPSTVSDGGTLVSSANSITTIRGRATELATSDMPYRKAPAHRVDNDTNKSGLYTRRPSHNNDDDEHTIHVIPLHDIRPSLPSSPKSPIYFHNPFGKPRQTPIRQKPRPRRNPKLALTLGEFFSSRNTDNDNESDTHAQSTKPRSPTSATNPCEEVTPMSPRTIRFPPRRHSRSSYLPPRRGSHQSLPHRSTSPEPAVESLPVPPSWRRKLRQPPPGPIDTFTADDKEPSPVSA